MKPSDLLISYSRALYSQWFFHKPTRCLFDAGEGVALTLGKKTFAVNDIFISHGHEDHIAGISNLVNVRNITSGEEKPLTIYYPRHDPWITALFEYIESKQRGLLRFPLYVQPIEPGHEIEIEVAKRPTRVRAIEAKHARARLCLSYEIEELRKIEDPDTGQFIDRYHPILFYSGDGAPVNYNPYGRIDIAIHDATFLEHDAGEEARRVDYRHATVEQAIEWGASQDVKQLILCHISERYHTDDIIAPALRAVAESGFRGQLYLAREHTIDLISPGS